MIVDFKIKNYRSIKEETLFSLEASGAKGKSDNVAEITTKNGKKFRLLKSAVIYGPNASGKSTLIRAFWVFRQLISKSYLYDINDDIKLAEAFALDTETINEPTKFELNFIFWDNQQYKYSVIVSKTEGIIEETLKYYPEKTAIIIFKRKGRKISSKNDSFFKSKNNIDTINPKRLFISELGNSGDVFWEDFRNYFVIGNSVVNSSVNGMLSQLTETAKRVFEHSIPEMIEIKNKVIEFIKLSDLGIKGLDLIEEEEVIKNFDALGEANEVYSGSRKQKRFKTYHEVYQDRNIVYNTQFDLLKQGSSGTIALIGLSTEILLSLNMKMGRPIWIDEIDNSLHPHMCRFLISLFNHPRSNPYNSQLIFATHETTLLDNNFRKDQIWITSKDKYGSTSLYSVHDLDIDGLRDEIPFDKWYMNGKFGGLPKIKENDIIFERETTK
jgi:AAA15 family ATPase/GTPase